MRNNSRKNTPEKPLPPILAGLLEKTKHLSPTDKINILRSPTSADKDFVILVDNKLKRFGLLKDDIVIYQTGVEWKDIKPLQICCIRLDESARHGAVCIDKPLSYHQGNRICRPVFVDIAGQVTVYDLDNEAETFYPSQIKLFGVAVAFQRSLEVKNV